MTQRKAIKTEYGGRVFDSKSEAVFAKCLVLAGQLVWPQEEVVGGHPWDFKILPLHIFRMECMEEGARNALAPVAEAVSGQAGLMVESLFPVYRARRPDLLLIEYKPSRPTATYLSNLKEKMEGIKRDYCVVYGSPWSVDFDEPGCSAGYEALSVVDDEWKEEDLWHLTGIEREHAKEALEYRFDLEAQS